VRWAENEQSGNRAERYEEDARQFLNGVFGNKFSTMVISGLH